MEKTICSDRVKNK